MSRADAISKLQRSDRLAESHGPGDRRLALSAALPRDERFGLTMQMRRAAVSVLANIAEGRRTHGAFLNHLSIAHGSLRELETHVMLAERLTFLRADATSHVMSSAAEVGRLITGLANSIRQRQQNTRT
jgi:four helix bundle protein